MVKYRNTYITANIRNYIIINILTLSDETQSIEQDQLTYKF